jgi:hypothetical protein
MEQVKKRDDAERLTRRSAGVVSLDLIGMKAALCTSLAGQTLCVYLYLSTRLIFKTAQLTAQIKTHMHTEQHSIFLYIFSL